MQTWFHNNAPDQTTYCRLTDLIYLAKFEGNFCRIYFAFEIVHIFLNRCIRCMYNTDYITIFSCIHMTSHVHFCSSYLIHIIGCLRRWHAKCPVSTRLQFWWMYLVLWCALDYHRVLRLVIFPSLSFRIKLDQFCWAQNQSAEVQVARRFALPTHRGFSFLTWKLQAECCQRILLCRLCQAKEELTSLVSCPHHGCTLHTIKWIHQWSQQKRSIQEAAIQHIYKCRQARGGSFKEKNYKSKKEFAYILPIECAQGDQPLRCPNRVFWANEPSAVPCWWCGDLFWCGWLQGEMK